MKVDGIQINGDFLIEFSHESPAGIVILQVESGWVLRGETLPPRPVSIKALQRKADGLYYSLKLPIPHQLLEDTFVRTLSDGFSVIEDFLISVHDDYLQKGGTNEVVKSSAD